ncbi:MAG: ribosome-binding factor A [Actinobacteria bacterium]|nr:ribosome-binding factor A [Actinomycetota bacterium]
MIEFKVDNDLNTAKVYYSAIIAEHEGRLDEVAEALDEARWPIQQVVNRSIRARKTPQIQFLPDDVLAAALRIDDILAERIKPAGEDVDGTNAADKAAKPLDGPDTSAAQTPTDS